MPEQFDVRTGSTGTDEPDAPTLTLARLARLLERAMGTGLSLPQYRVLGLLASGRERAGRLAARLTVTKPTLTALVDSLVERGYVSRDTSPGDRRVVQLSITPSGRTALEQHGALLRAALDDVLARCADPAAVLHVLDDVARALDARAAERIGRVLTAHPEPVGPAAVTS